MGRMLLADLPDDDARVRLEASTRQQYTRHTITDIETLMGKVALARRQGWCIVNEELEEGLISVAAPIINRAGRTVAAINVSGQANRTNAKVAQETLLPAILEAARAISRMLSVQSAG